MTPPTPATFEDEIHSFAEEQWGHKELDGVALKLCEEAGEVAGCAVKIPEFRSTIEDMDDEVGDCLIVLSQYASKRGTTLDALRARRFDYIKERALRINGNSQA